MTTVSALSASALGCTRSVSHVKFSAKQALQPPKASASLTSPPSKGLSGLLDSLLVLVGIRYDAGTEDARAALLQGDRQTFSAIKSQFNREGKRLNLSGLDLREKDLDRFDFTNCKLSGTVLDLKLPIPGLSVQQLRQAGFEITRDRQFVLGYRTKKPMFHPYPHHEYEVGKSYTAPWFSRDTSTICHPGLYLFPTLQRTQADYPLSPLIQVKVPLGNPQASNILQADNKFRTPTFQVVKTI